MTKPTPNFTRLDPGRPEIAILMDAMLRAREVVASRSWSTSQEPTTEHWWADVLADPRARIPGQEPGREGLTCWCCLRCARSRLIIPSISGMIDFGRTRSEPAAEHEPGASRNCPIHTVLQRQSVPFDFGAKNACFSNSPLGVKETMGVCCAHEEPINRDCLLPANLPVAKFFTSMARWRSMQAFPHSRLPRGHPDGEIVQEFRGCRTVSA